MNHIYDNSDQDSGAYPRLAHRFGLGVGAFVQARMEMMRDAIAQAVSEKSTDLEPVRITSVGEGPAREVAEYLEMGEPSHPVTFCLIDQEADALAYAESQCADALDT